MFLFFSSLFGGKLICQIFLSHLKGKLPLGVNNKYKEKTSLLLFLELMLLSLQNTVPFFFSPSNHVFSLSFMFKDWQSLEGGREVSCSCCIKCIYPAG